MSPTTRALQELRRFGAMAAVVERWNHWAKVRQDLFGFIDILAILGPNTIGIQVTDGTNHAARVTKIKAEPRARAWLAAGNLIEVWSYRKAGKRGQRKRWVCRKEVVTAEELLDVGGAE